MPSDEIRTYELSEKEREEVLQALGELLSRRDEVVFAVVFGGFLEARPFRDLDLGLYLARDVPAGRDIIEAALYAEELAAELSQALGLPMDVVVLNHAPPWLLYRALRGRVLLDRDPILRIRLYLMALEERERWRMWRSLRPRHGRR